MNAKSLQAQLQKTWEQIVHFRVALYLLLLIVLYGFIGWRVSVLVNTQPSQSTVDAKATTMSKPYIDQAIVDKVKQLEDNNVNVQALFDQARKNPFRE